MLIVAREHFLEFTLLEAIRIAVKESLLNALLRGFSFTLECPGPLSACVSRIRLTMWNEIPRMSSAKGFFQFHGVDNFLLEDHQAPMDSIAQCSLCKSDHKKSGSSNPMKFNSYHGYLPEIEEELSMPISYSQRRNEISPFNDKELSYIAHSQGSRGRGRSMLNNDLKFGFSDPSRVGIRSSVGLPYISRNTDELIMGRNISESFQRIDPEKGHMMISSPSHFALQTRPRDGRKMLLYAHEKIRCDAQEKFDVYDGRISLMDPMSGSRNLRNKGTQSPSFDVQYFRNGVLVPTFVQPKQTLSNFASELPSRFSTTSISSDQTEHPQIKVGLYKTELCRSWEETGYCKYAAKCQFAHGDHDLRPVPRHPKYKTELCRSYTETGLCGYGKRCRFIHKQTSPSSSHLEKKGSRRLSIFEKLSTGGGLNMSPRQSERLAVE